MGWTASFLVDDCMDLVVVAFLLSLCHLSDSRDKSVNGRMLVCVSRLAIWVGCRVAVNLALHYYIGFCGRRIFVLILVASQNESVICFYLEHTCYCMLALVSGEVYSLFGAHVNPKES